MRSKVDAVTNNLQVIFKKPSPGAWGQVDFLKHPVLFVSFKEEHLEIFMNSQRSILDFHLWKHRLPMSETHFDFFEYGGNHYLVVFLDNSQGESAKNLTHTIVHEAFHNYVQVKEKGWAQNKRTQGRGSIYPLLHLPRYYRWEMFQSLKDFLVSKDQQALQAFSWWYKKWKFNFPDEYNNYTDRLEGSAQFFSNKMMTILHNRTQNITRSLYDNLHAEFISRGDPMERFSLTSEGYLLGALAGIVLEQLKDESWAAAVAGGASPLEILAQKHKPKQQRVDHKVQNQLLHISIREMQKIDKDGKLDQIISDLANPKTLRVMISNEQIKSHSFTTSGMYQPFFNFKNVEKIQIIALTSNHRLEAKNFSVDFKPGDYWIIAGRNPCFKAGTSTLLLFDSDELEIQKRRIHSKVHPRLELTATEKITDNTTWYCVNP